MSRTTRARAKLVRKFKENIFGNPKFDRILAKKPYPPGAHGKKMRRRLSDYGQQLEEKQKLRLMYDLSEKQFHTLYLLARKTQAATGEKLLQLLESRLDTVVYRSGFAPTLAAARQLVNHGHVTVDNQKIDIASYRVKIGQVVGLSGKGQKIPQVAALLSAKDNQPPQWLKRKAVLVKLERLPERKELNLNIQEQLIVEYYSR
ncbi:30S ribosomal protein S4 [Candidatus Beckwithbacteria bacterium RIFCSPLOWO2_02_FULL_47_23]|uniref:Small ribosomal subunit protein uS4 n=2 Tax=Candidatus Beckwithiibacteriota TaxID=1752726 RepID=A0A1F5E3I7_9BACT|nr:MAG: 30S ribosomal protein S4 [Candidatus Beckwithbacteria bacterium RIFCSPHIGHO2_12_FULL_47_17]OGD61866.1 MAG: 30S ribosomal protein S4 [Candidatus Beckwithbacteria bacterium RIFCSPLOWO2_02_FULL_47_23]